MFKYDLLKKMGLSIDNETGHLFYDKLFQPISLSYELIFIRHGETFGNCGQCTADGKINKEMVEAGHKNKDQRIYQGNVDTEINRLTLTGQTQAINLSKHLEQVFLKNNWRPDIILYSPLSRAKDTGMPFIQRNNLYRKYFAHSGIKEMSFGFWDNRRICDLPLDDPCHSFYMDQNALVKKTGINGSGLCQEGESFCDVLMRAHSVLITLEKHFSGKKIILFSHSMFGSACRILSGIGKTVESGGYLAIDGHKKDGTSYAIPHTTPLCLSQTSLMEF